MARWWYRSAGSRGRRGGKPKEALHAPSYANKNRFATDGWHPRRSGFFAWSRIDAVPALLQVGGEVLTNLTSVIQVKNGQLEI
ncbi:hypothetical protein JOC55_004777 [Paenibacillus sacheonensis]|nr:hypothetical protein [Paenibacillus sacheonensis]